MNEVEPYGSIWAKTVGRLVPAWSKAITLVAADRPLGGPVASSPPGSASLHPVDDAADSLLEMLDAVDAGPGPASRNSRHTAFAGHRAAAQREYWQARRPTKTNELPFFDRDRVEFIRSFRAEGRSIDERAPCGATPLMFAIRGGHHMHATLLLNWGADATLADRDGVTALHDAIKHYSTHRFALLKRADPFARAVNGSFPFEMALRRGMIDFVQLALTKSQFRVPRRFGTAAHSLAYCPDLQTWLLAKVPERSLVSRDGMGRTPAELCLSRLGSTHPLVGHLSLLQERLEIEDAAGLAADWAAPKKRRKSL